MLSPAIAAICLAVSPGALPGITPDLFTLPALAPMRFDYALLDPPDTGAAPEATDGEGQPQQPGYGEAGSSWLSLGGAYAYDFVEEHDINLHGMWSWFLGDRFELGVEGAGWYFAQKGEDTGGVSAMLVLRYHFWSGPEGDFAWTAFFEGGSGVLVGFDEVPDGGTGFNFIQRGGFGLTRDLDGSDGPNHGARLLLGVRWHHISNGRIEGDARNPARDSLLVWAGVVLEF